MFLLCRRIIVNEEIPDVILKTLLMMIWKRKGPMNMLQNQRFLHMKDALARTIDALIVQKIKPQIVKSTSKFQVGGIPGHSMEEHLLVLKTLIARMEEKGEGVIFLGMDIMSFFDKEDIYDCLETLENIGVNKKARRLWYLINKDAKIQVKTAFVNTKEVEVGNVVGPGMASTGLISAINLDKGLQKHFNNATDVNYYGSVRLQPLAYQDDVGSLCKNISSTRSQAIKMVKVIKEKNLEAHPVKTAVTVLGSKKFRKAIEKELKVNPIDFDKFGAKMKTNEKYLGQVLEETNSKSALATAKERSRKIKGATMEIKSIIEDYQM